MEQMPDVARALGPYAFLLAAVIYAAPNVLEQVRLMLDQRHEHSLSVRREQSTEIERLDATIRRLQEEIALMDEFNHLAASVTELVRGNGGWTSYTTRLSARLEDLDREIRRRSTGFDMPAAV